MPKKEYTEYHKQRLQKRYDIYVMRSKLANKLGCPLHQINKDGTTGFWLDSNSPTGYTQKCSYEGTCEWPCNGDC